MAVDLKEWRTPQFGFCSVCGKSRTVTIEGNITLSHAPCQGAGKPPKENS